MRVLGELLTVYATVYPVACATIWRNLRNDLARDYGPAALDAEHMRHVHLITALRAGLMWPAYLAVLCLSGAFSLFIAAGEVALSVREWLRRGKS
ncbi:hypothetical protein [Hyphomonas pacifica]|uniref:Uncharacterized protein n=1 Tax=Hyphomonas pacifica TaxID=1280941 RepID=A0A8B2PQP8_9PROT|nr:hypothetical protein [Hyphomonas pacifica]RAN30656.1 hypothetical protein HY3_05765 [Hyphomonas pacifica]